ncbi:hypothetical protein [Legionella sp. 16cNR16C]|uniref:hypothetical protein n=1 Tax=Legionella sp. 16cNR16C TaxID=2905656 RepID=UPI001E59C7AF|nr:hypothetical protein [Legionella sp. 16cNR16C]MCE3045763.1 hypothetical protein [Legionella sp. 16cNR16C]
MLINEFIERNYQLGYLINKHLENLKNHPDLENLDTILGYVENLLSSENGPIYFDEILNYHLTSTLAYMIITLHDEKLLNEASLFRLTHFAQPNSMGQGLSQLQSAGLLKANFELLRPFDQVLFSRPMLGIWNAMPLGELRQDDVNSFIAICRSDGTIEEKQNAIRNYVNQNLLYLDEEELVQLEINRAQSTHTASVHATTDLTAWLLDLNHRQNPVTLKSIQEITSLLEDLADETLDAEQKRAAIDCLKRLSSLPAEIVLDSEKKAIALRLAKETELGKEAAISPLLPLMEQEAERLQVISIEQFIRLIFHNISQDDQLDYWAAFVSALYEIQRGYNLDAMGSDNVPAEDKEICFGGTANKFCERLQGLSPLIKFIYVDNVSIILKIKQLLLNEILNTADELINEQANDEFVLLIGNMQDDEKSIHRYHQAFGYLKPQLEQLLELRVYSIIYGHDALDKLLNDFEIAIDNFPDITNPREAKDFSPESLFRFAKFVGIKNGMLRSAANYPGFYPADKRPGEAKQNGQDNELSKSDEGPRKNH